MMLSAEGVGGELRQVLEKVCAENLSDLRDVVRTELRVALTETLASKVLPREVAYSSEPLVGATGETGDEAGNHDWSRRHMLGYKAAKEVAEADMESGFIKKSSTKKSGKKDRKVHPAGVEEEDPTTPNGTLRMSAHTTGSDAAESVDEENAIVEGRHSSMSSMERTKSAVMVGKVNMSGFAFFRLGSQDVNYRYRTRVGKLVTSPSFDSWVCVLIVMNAALIGVQTDYEARYVTSPQAFRIVETIFAVCFTVELSMRIWVHRGRFLWMSGWEWNVFDVIVVSLQLFEEIGSLFTQAESVSGQNFSMVRVLRIMRIVRVIRLIRVLKVIGELRMLVLSVLSSLKALLWTAVLLFVMIYTISLYVTQTVSEHLRLLQNGGAGTFLDMHFGTLATTMLSMFQCISGGIDWADVTEPLMTAISPIVGLIITVYIAFTVLALLNVVTGCFVESVLKSAKAEKDLFMINNARELFQECEDGMETQMTWEMFQDKLDAPQMREFFKAIDVDPSEAKGLFFLLDLDNSGSVSAEEFLNGCLRLRGPAKALDLALLIQEVRHIDRMMRDRGGQGARWSGASVNSGANTPRNSTSPKLSANCDY